jgi:hypothetical protein
MCVIARDWALRGAPGGSIENRVVSALLTFY